MFKKVLLRSAASAPRNISVSSIKPHSIKPEIYLEILSRVWSGAQGEGAKYSEQQLTDTLKAKFPEANINVLDISGGCGAMFEILVESKEFKGIPIIKQHRLITETLKNEIKDMHGIRIHTSVPKS